MMMHPTLSHRQRESLRLIQSDLEDYHQCGVYGLGIAVDWRFEYHMVAGQKSVLSSGPHCDIAITGVFYDRPFLVK